MLQEQTIMKTIMIGDAKLSIFKTSSGSKENLIGREGTAMFFSDVAPRIHRNRGPGAHSSAVRRSRSIFIVCSTNARKVRGRLSLIVDGSGSLDCRIFGRLRPVRMVRKSSAMAYQRARRGVGRQLWNCQFTLEARAEAGQAATKAEAVAEAKRAIEWALAPKKCGSPPIIVPFIVGLAFQCGPKGGNARHGLAR
jgi:hypothetical protein